MKKHEKLLIIDFLNELTDHQSCAGCNDWKYPETWTNEQKIEFEKKIIVNYDDEDEEVDEDEEINYCRYGDSSVVYTLIAELEKELE